MDAVIIGVLLLICTLIAAAFVKVILIVNFAIVVVVVIPLIIRNSTNWRVFVRYRIIQWSPLVEL
jgi:hypothetical protein